MSERDTPANPSRRSATNRRSTPNGRAAAKRSSAAASNPHPDAEPDADSEVAGEVAGEVAAEVAAGLSFNEARTALDLTLAALQASDLAIEEMAGLYQRANAYAARCQSLLEAVEQDVIQWEEPLQPDG